MAGIVSEKKYILVNHSDNSKIAKSKTQLCLPSNSSGKGTLKAGEHCILKGKNINDYFLKLAKGYKDKKFGCWLEIREYSPKKKEVVETLETGDEKFVEKLEKKEAEKAAVVPGKAETKPTEEKKVVSKKTTLKKK